MKRINNLCRKYKLNINLLFQYSTGTSPKSTDRLVCNKKLRLQKTVTLISERVISYYCFACFFRSCGFYPEAEEDRQTSEG